MQATDEPIRIERVQLNVRLEKRLIKVLKALAEYGDMSLTELLEDLILHALEGESTFSLPETQLLVCEFKRLYGADFDVHAGGRFAEKRAER